MASHFGRKKLKMSPKMLPTPELAAATTAVYCRCSIWLLSLLFLLFFFFAPPVQMRRLQRCELAGQLYILDVPKTELPLWLCIAHYESRYNTHVVGNRNADGSGDYGIFQISSRYWCQPEEAKQEQEDGSHQPKYYAFNECNVKCNALLQDDITESVACAKTIQRRQGWSAWSVYSFYCSNRTLVQVNDCFE